MPVIRTTLLEGFSTEEQRAEICTRLADTLVDIFGEVTKPYIFSIVDEIKPGAWSIGGNVANEAMIANGVQISQADLAKKLTVDRVGRAYDALATGDRAEMEKYWDQNLEWLVPGESRVSGTKKGLDDFLGFMKVVGELSGGSFEMTRTGIFLSGDQSIDLSHNTATRAGDSGRRLSIDVAHVLRWSEGRIVEGRGAIFGSGTTEFNNFWA
jgi:ketosteroid isomerase-like protein/phenylpyruvate tautomerase PptA (4-oxalocrotonate tautomerase family)